MAVIFAPRPSMGQLRPNALTNLGQMVLTAYGTYQSAKDEERKLAMEEERRRAEAEDRRSRMEMRDAQMDQMRRTGVRQEREDLLEEANLQAMDALNRTAGQQEEIKKILSNISPTAEVKTPGLVDLSGQEIAGTGGTMQVDIPKMNAPTQKDLLMGMEDTKISLPAVGAVPARDISVRDRALKGLTPPVSQKVKEGLELGTHVQLDERTWNSMPEEIRGLYRPGQVVSVGVLKDMGMMREPDPPKTLTINGRHMGWNEDTRAFDIDYGPAGQPKGKDAFEGNPYFAGVNLPEDATGPEDLTDEERKKFIASLPVEIRAAAQKVANNEIPIAAAGRGKMREAVSAAASWINPNWDVTQYEGRKRTATEYAGGMTHRNIVAINTLSHHLIPFAEAADALSNTNIQKLNTLKNYFSRQFGEEEIANFDTLHSLVSDEIANVFKTTGATDSAIQNAAQTIYDAQSPKQLLRAIRSFARLAEGRISAVGDKYDSEFGEGAFEKKGYISDAAKHAYEMIGKAKKVGDISKPWPEKENDFDPGGLGLGQEGGEAEGVPPIF